LRPGAGDFEGAWSHPSRETPHRAENRTEAHGEDSDLADYLYWLATDPAPAEHAPSGASRFTPATISSPGLVLGELRTRSAAAALSRKHGLRIAMAAADRVRRLRQPAPGLVRVDVLGE
jgi:hypothetical protein